MISFNDLSSATVVAEPPEGEPVTVAEVKAAAKCTYDLEDDLFASWIAAAREIVESDSRRRLLPQVLRLSMNRFPTREIEIHATPVRELTEISYVDTDGERVVLEPEQYLADLAPEPAIVVPAYGLSWPTARNQPGSVLVTFDGGYAEPPALAKQLIRNLVAHWFLNRGDVGSVPAFMERPYWQAIERLRPGGYP